MDLRNFFRATALLMLLGLMINGGVEIFTHQEFSRVTWTFLVGFLAFSVLLFRGWPQVFAWAGNGVARAGRIVVPRVNAGAHAVGHQIRSNPLGVLTVVLFAISLGCFALWLGLDDVKALGFGIFFLEIGAIALIAYRNWWGEWRIYWFLFSLFNLAVAVFAGASWFLIAVLAISTVLSIPYLIHQEDNFFRAMWAGIRWLAGKAVDFVVWATKHIVKLLSGKYSWELAFFSWWLATAGLGFYFIEKQSMREMGQVLILAAVGFFLAFALLGTKKHLVK